MLTRSSHWTAVLFSKLAHIRGCSRLCRPTAIVAALHVVASIVERYVVLISIRRRQASWFCGRSSNDVASKRLRMV